MKLLNASEAYKESKKNFEIQLEKRKKTQMEELVDLINKTILDGKTGVHYPLDIYDDNIALLRRFGYKLQKSYRKLPTGVGVDDGVDISWENALVKEG